MESGINIGDLQLSTAEAKFEKFFRSYYHKEILRVIHGYPETKSLVVDFNDLDKYDITLADELINNPDATLVAAENALHNIEIPLDVPTARMNVRFSNLPASHRIMIRNLRSVDVGRFIALDGMVRKVTDVRPKLVMGVFQCPYCGHETSLPQDGDGDKLREPLFCEECDKKSNFTLLAPKSTFIDAQKILIQEDLEDLRGGEHPKQIAIYLEDDLSGKIMPGDRVEIAGILRATKKIIKGTRSKIFDIFIEGNSFRQIEMNFEDVEITKEDEKEIKKLASDPLAYDKIRDSIAPHIYGYKDIKEAIMYQLFSSPTMELPDGGRIRGDSHIVLIGEPATGKSEILQYVARELAPRGIYASGKGTSTAGLTAAATKDEFSDGGWSLEAGALVLADMGVACLHPDSKIIADDRIVRIESLFDEERKFNASSNGEEVEICHVNANVASLTDAMQVINTNSSFVRRKKVCDKILEISTASGFKLKLTPDHKLLHGNSLEWREARKFAAGDYITAPLKLPSNSEDIYLLDIMPADWIVMLDAAQKTELRKKVLNRYLTLSEFNRKYAVSRDFLSGRSGIKVRQLRKVLKDLGCHDEWKTKCLRYAKRRYADALKVCKITPELAYFLGFVYGDGNVRITKRRSQVAITQSLKNFKQIEKLKELFSSFSDRNLGVYKRKSRSTIRGRRVESDNVILYSNTNLLAFLYDFLISSDLSNILRLPDDALRAFIAGCLDSDGCISVKKGGKDKVYETVHIEFLLSHNEERDRAFMLALRKLDCYSRLITKSGVNRIRITGRVDAFQLLEGVKDFSVKAKELPIRKHMVSATSDKVPTEPSARICSHIAANINKSVLLENGVWSTVYAYQNKWYQPSREQMGRLDYLFSDSLPEDLGRSMKALLCRDYFLDKVTQIREVDYTGYVYDLFVPNLHNFACEGLIVHNCVDEFDKMEENDRAAMHEALEQQQVSIAKAGMLATFRARCSVLAAANPKYGRFDKYRAISEQVNLTPTILSRFDLIFFVEDDLADTRQVAKHILDTAVGSQDVASPISSDFVRKYIAYARQNTSPALSPVARESIENFYVEMREAAQNKEDMPIPMTARQLWAIIRIARASARVRLSDSATVEDVERAIRLVKYSLKQAGMDVETGKVDIDKIMVGVTKSQRDRINEILHIIRSLEEEFGTARKSEIVQRGGEKGITERNAEELLEKLKKDGNIYEPKLGVYKIV